MKLSDYVLEFVARQGVRHVFLVPGGGAMHLNDSLGRSDLEYVCTLHEQAASIAADAYAQYTGNLGVAMVTTGPGGTNAITGVAASWLDSIPTLTLSGQVKRADLATGRGVRQMGFQEIDITTLVSPITKYAVTVLDPASVRFHLEKALYLARHGRPGPVWIDIPLDVQATQIEPAELAGFTPEPEPETSIDAWVDEAIASLNAAQRPVLLAGNGLRPALPEFSELIELLQIPVLASWKAIDFLPEDHPLYAGRPGLVGQRGANFTLQNSDWLMTLGARLDFGQIGFDHSTVARAAFKVVVDIDPAEIRKLKTRVDVPAVTDAGRFLKALLARRKEIRLCDRSAWLARTQDWKKRYPVFRPEYWDAPDYVNNYAFIEALGEAMNGGDLLVPGSSGACSEITMQAFAAKPGQRVFNSEGLGPMGFGIAAAVGGALASGRRTVSIDGDGGFQMNLQELETVRRLNLPLKLFVLNNNGYGSIRATQRAYFQSRFVASDPSSGLTLPDTQRIAAAYGLPSSRISNHVGLRAGICQVLETPGPFVCEVMVSPDQMTMPKVSSAQRPDGTMFSKPLEDLWPFLDRDEFLSQMIVPPVAE